MATAYQKCCSVRQDSAGDRCRKGTGNLHAPLPEVTDDKAYLEHELQHSRPKVLCLALTPEHMTGKLVKES